MNSKNLWVDLSLLNFCIVSSLGFILRSKILFSLPGINYLYLLDAHSHFAFEGWVTLALLVLLVGELLPEPFCRRPIYQWLFGGIFLSSWGILLSSALGNNGFLHSFFSAFFISTSYVFGWIFIKDIRKTGFSKTVKLLSVSAVVSLILSSAGPIALAWLRAIKSHHAILYRDASYFYLHLQYNGFFTLAVFALLFHRLYPLISKKTQQHFYWFSILLCVSIFPSLFLSFLWQNPGDLFRIIASIGSILIFVSVTWFIVSVFPIGKYFRMAAPLVRYILLPSIAAFILKMFLQSFTIFPSVGNAVFGDRPVIIGFLHLVFLGFVTPFILVYYVQKGMVNIKIKLTGYALILFMLGVVFNEITLMLQGMGAMYLKSSFLFSWLLWAISIWLMVGAILFFMARIKTRSLFSMPG